METEFGLLPSSSPEMNETGTKQSSLPDLIYSMHTSKNSSSFDNTAGAVVPPVVVLLCFKKWYIKGKFVKAESYENELT